MLRTHSEPRHAESLYGIRGYCALPISSSKSWSLSCGNINRYVSIEASVEKILDQGIDRWIGAPWRQRFKMAKRTAKRKVQSLAKAAALITRALQYYERGDKQAAEEKLRRACAIEPPVAQAHYNLGYFHYLEGHHAPAEEALLEALEQQPDYSQALFTLASVYMDAARFDEAQAWFLKAERLTPNDLDIQLNLGMLAARTGHGEEAFDRLDRCIVAGHRADAARFHRATCLQDLGRLDEALMIYRALVKTAPDWREPVLKALVTRPKGRFPRSQSELAAILGL